MALSSAPLRIIFLTIFPEIFESFLATSLVRRARDEGLLESRILNIRDFADPPHFKVDDTPYGGGAGMLLLVAPLTKAIQKAKELLPAAKVVLLSAAGRPFSQAIAQQYSQENEMIFVCGRYEGIDQRVVELCVDEELNVGNFIVMGGEVPAMLVLEATLRLRPGVLGNEQSSAFESFSDAAYLEAPQYSKPATWNGLDVPEVLLSGNHKCIAEWRQTEAAERTRKVRPDLPPSSAKKT